MKELYPFESMEVLSGLFGLTRQGYYKQNQEQTAVVLRENIVLELVKEARKKLHRCGGRVLLAKIKEGLEAHQIQMGRDAFFNLLASNGLLVKTRKRKVYTTNSNHWFRKYPNLLIDQFIPTKAGQLWVSDITYLRLEDRFIYLALITDAYSRKIVGYCLSESLQADLCVKALKMALANNEICTGLIHHSDRGLQYCSDKYVKILNKKGIRISMTQSGSPYDNALAERVNGIIKNEVLPPVPLVSFKDALSKVDEAIDIYNNYKPHSSCNMLTPSQAHQQEGVLKKHWKTYRKKQKENSTSLSIN
ncbi:MAG TPA: IS3 family transposase [Cytophagales bacterium]|nr:IS3 family transposase [Cytophagales bacterium]